MLGWFCGWADSSGGGWLGGGCGPTPMGLPFPFPFFELEVVHLGCGGLPLEDCEDWEGWVGWLGCDGDVMIPPGPTKFLWLA